MPRVANSGGGSSGRGLIAGFVNLDEFDNVEEQRRGVSIVLSDLP